MGPESSLFHDYEQQLDEQITEMEFSSRIRAALDAIDDRERQSDDYRNMLDGPAVHSAVSRSDVPDAALIADAIFTPKNGANSKGVSTVARLTPPYDQFERSNVPCATYVARLRPASTYSTYNVFRVVLATTAQKMLPDGRGVYVAKHDNGSVVTIFSVHQEQSLSDAHFLTATEIKGDGRKPVLEELEKAAAAVRARPPLNRYGRS